MRRPGRRARMSICRTRFVEPFSRIWRLPSASRRKGDSHAFTRIRPRQRIGGSQRWTGYSRYIREESSNDPGGPGKAFVLTVTPYSRSMLKKRIQTWDIRIAGPRGKPDDTHSKNATHRLAERALPSHPTEKSPCRMRKQARLTPKHFFVLSTYRTMQNTRIGSRITNPRPKASRSSNPCSVLHETGVFVVAPYGTGKSITATYLLH